MKQISESQNKHNWPRKSVKTIETRKRDLVIRIADWTKDRDEPAFDVEVYIGGIYDYNESKTFCTKNAGKTKAEARELAVNFAAEQIKKLL